MRYLYIFFLFFFISCVNIYKTYICGDRKCVDKKEFKEYFAKNLTIEIDTQKFKKRSSVDLVGLNTSRADVKKPFNEQKTDDGKLNKKEQKALIKAEKNRLKKERKIKKIEEKNKIKEEKKLAKLRKKDKINIKNSKVKKKTESILKSSKIPPKQNISIKEKIIKKTVAVPGANTSICIKMKDCDINKIAEILIKKGKEKNFPDITLK